MAADSVQLVVVNKSTISVVLPDSYIGGSTAAQRTVISSDYDLSETYDSTTTPAPIAVASYAMVLTGGTDTIDFTALAITGAESGGVPAATEDMTGYRVCHFEFETPVANGPSGLNIAPGAANPYILFGTANDIQLLPGTKVACTAWDVLGALPAVSATVKTIDVVGTAADILNLKFVFEDVPAP